MIAPGDDDPGDEGFDEARVAAALDAAFVEGGRVFAETAAEHERMRLWHLLRDCVLVAVRSADGDDLDLGFDVSYLRARIPDAPDRLVVRLLAIGLLLLGRYVGAKTRWRAALSIASVDAWRCATTTGRKRRWTPSRNASSCAASAPRANAWC